MVRLGETELKKLLQGGEMDTVKLKVAASRSLEMADVYAAWPMPAVALVFVSVFPKRMPFFPWSMRDFEPFPSIDTTFQMADMFLTHLHIRHSIGHAILAPPIVLSEVTRICAMEMARQLPSSGLMHL